MSFQPKEEKQPLISRPDALTVRLKEGAYWINLFSALVLLATFIMFCSKFLTKQLIVDTDCIGLAPYAAFETLNWLAKMVVNLRQGRTDLLSIQRGADEESVDGDTHTVVKSCSAISSKMFFESNILMPIAACINSIAQKALQSSNGHLFTGGFILGWTGLVKNLWQQQQADTPIPEKLWEIVKNPAQLLLAGTTGGVGFAFIEDSPLQGNENAIRFATSCFCLLVLVSHDVHKTLPAALGRYVSLCKAALFGKDTPLDTETPDAGPSF